MTTSRRLNLSVQYACNDINLPDRAAIRKWVRQALDIPTITGGSITIRFVDEKEGLQLNETYRGKNYATNVLSFPYEYQPQVMGDLVICSSVVTKEATEQNKPLPDHYAHLVVHGTLHLRGYDHETSDEDAEEMEDLERKILASLGIADPY